MSLQSPPYTPIVATLAYVMSPDQSQVLMIHRNTRPDDPHLGKYNGLGGKLWPREDAVQGMRREVFEESGLICEHERFAGTVSWPGFGQGGEDWLAFIFRVERFTGTLRTHSSEGVLSWVFVGDVPRLPLWDGDRHFLPLVFAEPLQTFFGVMPYVDGQPESWSYHLVP